jgi:hypothetical protein
MNTKKSDFTNEGNVASSNFAFSVGSNKNNAAVSRVCEKLPEFFEKTKYFDRSNSQTTLNMMTLTMLNGQSPMRLLRQILAEVESRKMALAEAQLNHAKALHEINEFMGKEQTPVIIAELRLRKISLDVLESKVNGAFKDIATLADAYDNIKQTHGIGDWDEATFEAEEKRHHVRRGFELLYRNLIEYGRAKEAIIEYLQQYGVHIQVALGEVSGYITIVNDRIQKGARPDASDMEVFFDQMADKYVSNSDIASVRIFGKANFANTDYMMLTDKP